MSGQPSPGSDRRDPLSFDELIALIVAFLAIGAILWWSLGQKAGDWFGQRQIAGGRAETTQPDENGLTAEPAPTEVNPAAPTTRLSPNPATGTSTTVEVSPTAVPGAAPEAAPGGVQVPGVVAPVVIPASPAASPTATATPIQPSGIVVPTAAPGTEVGFSDVPNAYWAYPFISELSKRGIVSGFADGTFRPEQPVTRAEYAASLSKVLSDAQQDQIPFNDVPPSFWGTQAIDEAVRAGFLKGYPDATFQPGQQISKLQVLLSLANGFKLAKPSDPNTALQAFQDRDQIPEWAKPAVGAATQAGVVVNHPEVSQFNPNQPVTRAEVAAMLYQALTTTGQVQPIQSNYVVRP